MVVLYVLHVVQQEVGQQPCVEIPRWSTIRHTENRMSIRVAARRSLYAIGGALLAFVLCFGVVPHLLESMQLSIEASKALDALAAHGMESFRATPCQRKFTGVVVEGQVASADDADEVETVLRNAGIKANIWMAIRFPGVQLGGQCTETRKRDPSQVRTEDPFRSRLAVSKHVWQHSPIGERASTPGAHCVRVSNNGTYSELTC